MSRCYNGASLEAHRASSGLSGTRQYSLFDDVSGIKIGSCSEEQTSATDYPCDGAHCRRRRTLHFGDRPISWEETCFCHGKLGHKLWSSGLVLSLYLANCFCVEGLFQTQEPLHQSSDATPLHVVELGAGVGLPSIVARDILQARHVTATDFWELENPCDNDTAGTFLSATERHGRYVPKAEHGANLVRNVGSASRFDWRKDRPDIFFDPATLLLGSDLLYDKDDVKPLWRTLVKFLRSGRRMVRDENNHNGSDTDDDTEGEEEKASIVEETEAPKKKKLILLVSPLHPDVRDDLPAFLQLLQEKADVCKYVVTLRTLRLEVSDEDTSAPQTFVLVQMQNKRLVL